MCVVIYLPNVFPSLYTVLEEVLNFENKIYYHCAYIYHHKLLSYFTVVYIFVLFTGSFNKSRILVYIHHVQKNVFVDRIMIITAFWTIVCNSTCEMRISS